MIQPVPPQNQYNLFLHTRKPTVIVGPKDSASGCIHGYTNIRGTENLPVTLPGLLAFRLGEKLLQPTANATFTPGGIPLAPTARLHLQKNTWATRGPRVRAFALDISAPGQRSPPLAYAHGDKHSHTRYRQDFVKIVDMPAGTAGAEMFQTVSVPGGE